MLAGAATIHAATKVTKADFGKTHDGKSVEIFTLTNEHGLEARICTYGGVVVSLKTPDRTGKMADIVLGFDNLEGYLNPSEPYFGALIGRYGNRIGHAKFTLAGIQYKLPANIPPRASWRPDNRCHDNAAYPQRFPASPIRGHIWPASPH